MAVIPAPSVLGIWTLPECPIGLLLEEFSNDSDDSSASAVWPAANLAIFVPFTLYDAHKYTHGWVHNGAAVSGNVDIGIYSSDNDAAGTSATRLASTGSTAQSGTTTLQIIAFTTAITLGPGNYYIGLSFDNGTGTTRRHTLGTLGLVKVMGLAQMATAFALPATATLATVANDYVPSVGIADRNTF